MSAIDIDHPTINWSQAQHDDLRRQMSVEYTEFVRADLGEIVGKLDLRATELVEWFGCTD